MVGIVLILALVPDDNLKLGIKHSDKIKHATAFFVLSLLLNRASSTIQRRFRNMGALLLFGIFIELMQFFFPARYSSLDDIAADSVGIILFQVTYSLLKFFELKFKDKKRT